MAKIAIIISSLYACGGEERVVSLMANEWVKQHDVTIFTYENREAEGNNRNDYFLSDRIKVERVQNVKDNIFRFGVKLLYRYTGMTSGNLSQKLIQKAFYPQALLDEWIKRINEGGFDLVIGISGMYTLLLGQIKDRISAKAIGWEHSSYEGYFAPLTGYIRNQEKLFKEYTATLDDCVVLNEDIQSKYKKHLGLKTSVMYNPRSFVSPKKACMGLQCFVTCGRVEAEKGYDDLIKAFHKVYAKNKEWKLVIIGGGSLKPGLEKLIEELGLVGVVTITGYIHDVNERLLQGSVFVMTSRWEGFPMTITEALEVGLPVISYDIPAMQPLVTDDVEGKIVPAFDNDALAQTMLLLANDKDMRERMAEAAIRKAESLSAENIAKKWFALFDRILDADSYKGRKGEKTIC